jgi:hypothetical protein
MPPKLYCGKKVNAPAGTVKGSPGACFKKGVGVGASQLETHPPLNTLTKDIIREYAMNLGIRGYYNMTKEQLIEAVTNTGKYKLGIQPKNWATRGEIRVQL